MGRKEDIINNIHRASIEEFIHQGLEGSSMERIAQNANISKRTLYKYYPNKDAIFNDIVKSLIEKVCANFTLDYKKEESIQTQIEKIVDSKIQLMTNTEFLKISKLVFAELIKSNSIDISQLKKYQESEVQFYEWIENAKKDGKITSSLDSNLIATQFHSILKGQIFYPVLLGVKKLTDEDIKLSRKTTVDFFISTFCS